MVVSARRSCSCLLLAVFLCWASSAWSVTAAPFTPVLEITPDDPGIDDRLMLRLSIEVLPNLLVNFPRLADKIDGFAVVGQRALEPEADVIDTREWVQQYRLEPETTGDLLLPALTIVVQDPKTLEGIEVTTPKTPIHIRAIVPAETDLRHIKDILPPVPLPALGSATLFWLSLVVLAIALLATAGLWLHRRRRRADVQPPVQPPHLAALEALSELRSESLGKGLGVERFHIRLAAVVRQYLQDGFALPAPRKTTEELLAGDALDQRPLNGARALLAEPLDQCDLVKFARYEPSAEEMRAALDDIDTFVQRTSKQALLLEDGAHAD